MSKNRKNKKENQTAPEEQTKQPRGWKAKVQPEGAEKKSDIVEPVHEDNKELEKTKSVEKKSPEKKVKDPEKTKRRVEAWGRMGAWFQTICWVHIPIFGFWYMVVLAIRKKTPQEKKDFARGYILYKILVYLMALTILYIFYRMGLSFVESVLRYVDLHVG